MARFENPFSLKSKRSRPKAEILNIGTELLTGSTLNTNAQYLGRELTDLGFEVTYQTSCRDELSAIQESLRAALKRSEVIFVSGGLGPTPDDITRESLAAFFQVPLVLSRAQYRQIQRHYRKRGQKVPFIVRREAEFPANAKPVFNRFGIALGFIIEHEKKVVIVVPGVPGELTRLYENHLRSYLKKKFPGIRRYSNLVVKTVGLSEPAVMHRLGRSFFKFGNFQFGIYPSVGEVSLRIYADQALLIRRLKRHILKVMKEYIFTFSEEMLEQAIARKLISKGWTVALAESCTGGQVSEKMTRVPGASRYFFGSVVAYQNDVKVKTVGVSKILIKRKGAASKEVALSLARGIREKFGTTLGVAVTGIAGPTGGTTGKPIGLMHIAIVSPHKSKTWEEHFAGDRGQIQNRASKKVLEYLWRWVCR